MMNERDRVSLRAWLRRRLLSVQLRVETFALIGVIEGSQTGLQRLEIKRGNLDDALNDLIEEIDEHSSAFANLYPGAGELRFIVEANDAARDNLGRQEFRVATPPSPAQQIEQHAPYAKGAAPVAAGLESPSVALVKMALDHSNNYARLFLGAFAQILGAATAENAALRARCAKLEDEQLDATDAMRELMMRDAERSALILEAKGKEHRKNRLLDAAEDILPGLLEQATGEGAIHDLLQQLDVKQLEALGQVMTPGQRQALGELLKRKAEREKKANKRKDERKQRDAEVDGAFARTKDNRSAAITVDVVQALFPQLKGGDA